MPLYSRIFGVIGQKCWGQSKCLIDEKKTQNLMQQIMQFAFIGSIAIIGRCYTIRAKTGVSHQVKYCSVLACRYSI